MIKASDYIMLKAFPIWLKNQPEFAREFLNICFSAGVPEQSDLTTLTVVKGSFIDSDQSAFYSDTLYSIGEPEEKWYIYIVAEHRHMPDENIASRVLEFANRVIQAHFSAGNINPARVIPVILYPGRYNQAHLSHFLDNSSTPGWPELSVNLSGEKVVWMKVDSCRQTSLKQNFTKEGALHKKMFFLQCCIRCLEGEILVCKSQEMGPMEHPDSLIHAGTDPFGISDISVAREAKVRLITVAFDVKEMGEEGHACQDVYVISRAGSLLAEGYSPAEVMKMTGLTTGDLKLLMH